MTPQGKKIIFVGMQLRPFSALRLLIAQAVPSRAASSLHYRYAKLSAPAPSRLAPEVVSKITPPDSTFKDLSFTFAVIALSAQVACAGQRLSRGKYLAFRDAFPLSGGICGKIRKLFALACHNHTPPEHYALQIKGVFPRQHGLYRALVERLFFVACADGEPTRDAERLLARIAHQLEISAADYSALRDRCLAPKAHAVLGVSKRIKATELKKHYYALMRRYHPDRFGAETLSPEVEMLLKLKASEINEAYRSLRGKAA